MKKDNSEEHLHQLDLSTMYMPICELSVPHEPIFFAIYCRCIVVNIYNIDATAMKLNQVHPF